jgi:hypothetical protein
VAVAHLAWTALVLNDYSFGGYLMLAGVLTFIDGRGEVGSCRALQSGASLADLRDFLKLLDEYKFDATLLEPDTPAVARLRPSAASSL